MGLARVAYDLPMAASPACVQKSSLRKVRGPAESEAVYATQALTLLTERLGWILSRVLKNTNSVGLCHPSYSNTSEGRCFSRTFPVRLSCNPRQNQKAWQKDALGGKCHPTLCNTYIRTALYTYIRTPPNFFATCVFPPLGTVVAKGTPYVFNAMVHDVNGEHSLW